MPFIDSKITVPVTAEKKETIKSELGKLTILYPTGAGTAVICN